MTYTQPKIYNEMTRNTVRPYQVFYSKILATLLPVFYCKKPGKV